MTAGSKQEVYQTVSREIMAVLEGEANVTARMATVNSLLSQAFNRFDWAGFYIVDPAKADELIVGPYQGTLGCLRIPFGKGVCGTAAAERKTQIVDDVLAIENHIVCDVNARSEIVVPVLDKDNNLIAVLDVDSYQPGAFDEVDKEHLEALLKQVFAS